MNISKKDYNTLYYQQNRASELARAKKYRKDNPEQIKKANKKWYACKGKKYRLDNIEKFRERSREWARKNPSTWNKENPIKAKEIQKKYRKNRVLTSNQRLRQLFANRILTAIKQQYGLKAYKTMELIGCSAQEAREHIEKQFKPNMNWGNHGYVWEIDHVIPISSFDLTNPEEQKRAFNYQNLQPLNWKENRTKSNRMKG